MSSKELIGEPVSLKATEPIETPYMRARDEWDSRLGGLVVQAKNWRLLAFGSLLLSFGLLGTNTYFAVSNSVYPLVITVEKGTGRPEVIGRLGSVEYKPKEQEIKYFLQELVLKVRAVSKDPVVVKSNWEKAYKFLSSKAALKLNELANREEDSPLKFIGRRTVQVEPISIVALKASSSYQARWRERVYTQTGALMDDYTMSGIFTVRHEAPKREDILLINPLGLLVEDFQWNREL